MHDCLKILEASSFGHMFNMSSREVTNGNGAMPAFGEKLGPDDIEAAQLRGFIVVQYACRLHIFQCWSGCRKLRLQQG